jgi:hypothetical protein
MNMYSVFSVFTSRPTSLLASNRTFKKIIRFIYVYIFCKSYFREGKTKRDRILNEKIENLNTLEDKQITEWEDMDMF